MSEPVSKSKARRNRKNKAATANGSAASANSNPLCKQSNDSPAPAPAADVPIKINAKPDNSQAQPTATAGDTKSTPPVAAAPQIVDTKSPPSPPPPTTTAGSGGSGGSAKPTPAPVASASGVGVDTKSTASPPPPSATGSGGCGLGGSLNLKPKLVLTQEQIDHFKERGYLVVNQILTSAEVAATRAAYHATLKSQFGVDHNRLPDTAKSLKPIHIAGGILEIFYAPWKLAVCQNERLYGVISQLYAGTYASGKTEGFEHPHGEFDPNQCTFAIHWLLSCPDAFSCVVVGMV